jgi:hypothetical protein
MRNANRRQFLADVGRGMLVGSVGAAVAAELGLSAGLAAEGPDKLTVGALEPLVGLMQDTPADKLLPRLLDRLREGTDLRTLTAAGALANARTFGGHDYTGYHALMALTPALQMSRELPEPMQALPVFKVLYRNTNRIQQSGGRDKEALHDHGHAAAELPANLSGGEALQQATRGRDQAAAEATFAALVKGPVGEAFNHLQFAVQDEVDVHRVVLSWRSWALLDVTGQEHAHTLLRQSVRYCVDAEKHLAQHKRPTSPIRVLLPKLLEQHRLLGRGPGDRAAEDARIEELSQIVYGGGRDRAAEAVAAALAEGLSPESVGEALSLASTRLVLCDPGQKQAHGDKPAGSVHGASVGVHASDSANAWRNIARVSNPRNTFASLICGAYHTAGQNGGQHATPYPPAGSLDKVETKDADRLLQLTEAAIKERNQAGVCALVQRYGELGHPARPVFDLLLRYGVSEDGALHAEKYYRTVAEEFAASRPAFRWRHMVALARVTASEYGQPAPGYAEGRRLLKV